ncbi:MAG TPA: 2-dehydropantoate 2-reductase, partial [Steroidobacteraceae bacterium]|nr:2-dehydropantoate 2-reductase [Steroidobacteraceae bacterium]
AATLNVVASNLRFAVLGAGAVGSFFGGMLARGGAPVTLIARQAHAEAVRRSGLTIERAGAEERIEVGATTDLHALASANVVLFCVKTPDTEHVAKAAASHLAADALVISLQNGVDNADRIAGTTGIVAVPGVVYVAANLVAPGRVRHGGRGDLILGELPERRLPQNGNRPALAAVARQMQRCGVPCRIVEDIRAELWTKMVMNCAYNALSAIGRVRYGPLIDDPAMRDVMLNVVDEALAVAAASGVELPRTAVIQAVFELARAMPTATSSTAQDLERGKRTEIDALNGFLVRRGEALRIPVPYNRTLYALVKLLERRASDGIS